MSFQSSMGRLLGLSACCVILSLNCEQALGADVATTYKADDVPEFALADYEAELIECSALAAIHMWVDDDLGQNEGSEVRKTLASDYWIGVSKEYLSLAQKASGGADRHPEVGLQMRRLAAEWRRLTETDVSAGDWASWYELVDRCDTWRPANPTHAFYSGGKKRIADQS